VTRSEWEVSDFQQRKPKNYSASRICCYVPGEEPLDRHARRLAASWEGEPMVRAWCEHRVIQFNVFNRANPHPHAPSWVFKVQLAKGVSLARWIPALGRFVRIAFLTGKKTSGRKAAKVYDWEELLIMLESWFSEIPK